MKARRRGFALISALWLMVMLSGIGLHIAVEARRGRLEAANRIEGLQARAAAGAGVEHLRARLTERLALTGTEGAGRSAWDAPEVILADTIEFGATRYVVRAHDANARLHLNRASVDELTGLLVALRVDAGRAEQVAHAIGDWRDADELRHARGAEREEYLRAGAPRLPRNGLFGEVEELRDVLGVDAALLETISPYLTTAGSGFVNPNRADLPVLLSLPGITPEVAAAIVRLRLDGVAISSLDQFFAALPTGLRDGPLSRAGDLGRRLRFDTQEVAFESEGWLERTPARAMVRGTVVRAGLSLILSERRVL